MKIVELKQPLHQVQHIINCLDMEANTAGNKRNISIANRLLLIDLVSIYLWRPDIVDSVDRLTIEYAINSLNLTFTEMIHKYHRLLNTCGLNDKDTIHNENWNAVYEEYLSEDPRSTVCNTDFWILNAMWRVHNNVCIEGRDRSLMYIGVMIDAGKIESCEFDGRCVRGWDLADDASEYMVNDYADLDPTTSIAKLLDEICADRRECDARYAFWVWWIEMVRQTIAKTLFV